MLGMHMLDRLKNSFAKCVNVLGNIVGQVCVFASIPDLFNRVEIGGVGRQPFDIDPASKTFMQTFCSRAMNRPAVHDQDNAARQMLQKVRHEEFEIIGTDVVRLKVEIEPQMTAFGRDAEGRNDRKPVPSVPTIENGSLSAWRPSPAHQRLEHKAGFVQQNDATPCSSRFFLSGTNPLDAISRWPSRRVPGPAVRVSDNSSPVHLRCARLQRDGIAPRSVDKLPLPHAPGSTNEYDSRERPDLFSADRSTCDAACPRACKADGVVACFSVPLLHRACRHLASEPPSQPRRRLGELPRGCHAPCSATRWHVAAAVLILVGFLLVSCMIVSTKASSFL